MKLSDKAQASLNKVIEKFQNGDLSPITHCARIHLSSDAPASKWSFGNRVLAFAQTGEIDCRGFRQWQEAGRQVKKGSHAAFILTPVTIKKSQEQDGQTKEWYQCIGFSSIAVFASAMTEGETPLPDYTPTELPPLADVARRLGVNIEYKPLPSDRLGDCTIDGKNIRLATQDTAVFFHELAHAAHDRIEKTKGGQDPYQETIAEFTAAVLMELYGIRDHTGNAWRYIQNYAKDPLQAISKALSTIEKVLALLVTEPELI